MKQPQKNKRILASWILAKCLGMILMGACGIGCAQTNKAQSIRWCGEVITLQTTHQSILHYSLKHIPSMPGLSVVPATLILLVGGNGDLKLDEHGCPHALKGNSLIRMRPFFHQMGFSTALVDAPSDYKGEDGLGGFRISKQHAEDLLQVVEDLQQRIQGSVWVVGTSRGAISAVNLATHAKKANLVSGVILTSPVMLGDATARKSWVAQTVFDLPLETIRMPILLIGHQADTCVRSPAQMLPRINQQIQSTHQQIAVVKGGTENPDKSRSTAACEGQSAHGFIGQEEEVVAGIARFIRGGTY